MSYAQCAAFRETAIRGVLSVLPQALSAELLKLGGGKACFSSGLSEIRARAGEVSAAVFSGVTLPIRVALTKRDLENTVARICGGALYIHKESLCQSFLSMDFGVRVGIVGTYYEGTVGEASALVFRLPYFSPDIGGRLRALVDSPEGLTSALIYSPPAMGKTTAIRSLSLSLCEEGNRRIVAVDERWEFPRFMSECSSLDILYGYKKEFGIEVATRVLNPEMIIIDELSGEGEAEAAFRAAHQGVPIIATAHAGSIEELKRRPAISRLIDSGVFGLLVGLFRQGKEYSFSVKECR